MKRIAPSSVSKATPVSFAVSLTFWNSGDSARVNRIHSPTITRTMLNTRITNGRWDPVPVPPADAAAKIAPTPLLVVHGDCDGYCDGYATAHSDTQV